MTKTTIPVPKAVPGEKGKNIMEYLPEYNKDVFTGGRYSVVCIISCLFIFLVCFVGTTFSCSDTVAVILSDYDELHCGMG